MLKTAISNGCGHPAAGGGSVVETKHSFRSEAGSVVCATYADYES
jgi:hypothetical protein